jgi:hypothetical protein
MKLWWQPSGLALSVAIERKRDRKGRNGTHGWKNNTNKWLARSSSSAVAGRQRATQMSVAEAWWVPPG